MRERDTVTVAKRPSGTFATMIPMQNTRLVTRSASLTIHPIRKKVTPRKMATADTMKMNLSISMESGVWFFSADSERLAILPMTVSSPVLKQIPSLRPAFFDL